MHQTAPKRDHAQCPLIRSRLSRFAANACWLIVVTVSHIHLARLGLIGRYAFRRYHAGRRVTIARKSVLNSINSYAGWYGAAENTCCSSTASHQLDKIVAPHTHTRTLARDQVDLGSKMRERNACVCQMLSKYAQPEEGTIWHRTNTLCAQWTVEFEPTLIVGV